jgi:hypothetical protein
MARRALAHVCLAFAFVAAGIGYGAWSVQRTALDPSTSGDLARVLLDSPVVRDGVRDELAADVSNAPATDAEVRRAIEQALDDPRFTEAFATAVEDIYALVLGARQGTVTIDTAAVTASVRDAVARVDPQLAAQLETSEPLRLTLGDGGVPKLDAVDRRISPIAIVAMLAALALGAAGIALHPDKRKAVVSVGRRLVALGVGPIALFVLVPIGLGATGSDVARLLSDVMSLYGERVVPSAIAIVATGLIVWIVGRAWSRDRNDRWDADNDESSDDAPLAPVYQLHTPPTQAQQHAG